MNIALSLCVVSAFAAIAHEIAARHDLSLSQTVSIVGVLACVTCIMVLCDGRELRWATAGLAVAITCCGLGALTDARTGYVFDAVNYPATVAVLILQALDGSLFGSLAGAICAGASLGALYVLTRGRGIGLGDVKLAVCLGASVGAAAAIVTLGAAFVLGGAAGAYLLISKRATRGGTIRFAPYLAAAFCAIVACRRFV